jgi:hypothetical protein
VGLTAGVVVLLGLVPTSEGCLGGKGSGPCTLESGLSFGRSMPAAANCRLQSSKLRMRVGGEGVV